MAADPVIPFPTLSLETERSGDTVTVRCHGRVVSGTAPILQESVRKLINGRSASNDSPTLQDKVREVIGVAQPRTIVLDLTDISYMDSTGLGALVGLYVSAKRSGKQLKLINLSARVQELLRLTKLISVFEGFGEHL